MKNMRIVFTGGGSGGHVTPLIAIIREIREIYPDDDLEFFYLGPKDDFGERFLSQEGVKVKSIKAGKIRRYWNPKSTLQNIIDLFIRVPIGFLQSFFWIFILSPDVVFSKGGYGSIPVVLAAFLLRSSIFLHESDTVPGLANRIASRCALEIFVSFPPEKTEYFPQEKMICAGNPIRKRLITGSRDRAKEVFNITGEKPVIFIQGGSQGAQRINDMLFLILPELLGDFELIHQCGENNFEDAQAESKVIIGKGLEKYYHLAPFLNEEEMSHAYQAADIIVSRAGSSSIFEIAAVGKPSVLIPLSQSAQDHQVKNAYAYSSYGGAIVFEEIAGSTPHFFLERLRYLINRPWQLLEMSNKALEFARPHAGSIIAGYLVSYLTSHRI
jgi:UDP-N-acetylglucosamine--N-acetylmuramyl-(pentapeptide) pyrophosphoryl-undecaprenol N-acetylglucosamine transferase